MMQKVAQLELLQALLQRPSVNGDERRVTEYLAEFLANHGIASELIELSPGRAGLVAEIGPQNRPVVALAAHADTVAVGEADNWQYPPFAATVANKRIYGRGAADMKGGLAAMVCAVVSLHEQESSLPVRVRLIVSTDEEVGGRGAAQLVATGHLKDVVAVVIGEATSGEVQYAHNGSFDYQVTSRGKLAHSSQPSLGINAVMNLVKFINQEPTVFANAPVSEVLGPVIHSVTVFHGGEQLNSIPDQAYLQGNVRTIPEFDNEQTKAGFERLIAQLNQQPGVNLSLSVVADFAPVVTAPTNPLVQQMQQAVASVTGVQPPLAISNGATDASRYVIGNPALEVVIYGPGDEAQSHQVDESLSLDEYYQAIEIYQRFIMRS